VQRCDRLYCSDDVLPYHDLRWTRDHCSVTVPGLRLPGDVEMVGKRCRRSRTGPRASFYLQPGVALGSSGKERRRLESGCLMRCKCRPMSSLENQCEDGKKEFTRRGCSALSNGDGKVKERLVELGKG
jgi:hypothetical protein